MMDKSRTTLAVSLVVFFAAGLLFWKNHESLQDRQIIEEQKIIQELEKKDQELKIKKTKEDYMRQVSASVVNILCDSIDEDLSSGGSGVLLEESGWIITNSHVIPQDEEDLLVIEDGCLVALPDPETGVPTEWYWADPYVYTGTSDYYDLAYLSITEPYQDEDGEFYGEFGRTFPAFDDTEICKGNLTLGEGIRVLGYPMMSGGMNLTITEGVISSFDDDGFILVSAKIDQGNSGGLVIDQFGCMIGVAVAVYSG